MGQQQQQQQQQEKVSRTVPEPEPSTPPTGGVVADPREHGELGARRTLFPTPPTRRARATSAPSGSDIEGIAPIHQSAPRVADAQTQGALWWMGAIPSISLPDGAAH